MKHITLILLTIGTLFLFLSCALFPSSAKITIKNNAFSASTAGRTTATFHDVYLDVSTSTNYKKEEHDIAYQKDYTFTITWYGKTTTDVSVKSGSATVTTASGDSSEDGKTLCKLSDVKNGESITKTIAFSNNSANC